MRLFGFILLISFPALLPENTFAQKKTLFKPPVVFTSIGIRTNGDSVKVEEGVQLAGLPLKVRDKAGNAYEIANYRFLYRQKGYVENPENGKIEVVYTNAASRFDHTPLPKVWKENIARQLQKGEEFSFFEILVKDKQGRLFYAPDLHLYID